MKRKTTKLTALILSVFMFTAMLPMMAFAAEGNTYKFSEMGNAVFWNALEAGQDGDIFIYDSYGVSFPLSSTRTIPTGVTLYFDPETDEYGLHTSGVFINYGTMIIGRIYGEGRIINYGTITGDYRITLENHGTVNRVHINWSEWEIISATCENAGRETRTCVFCNTRESKVIPAIGHAWEEWKITIPATCTVAGEETRVCANDPGHFETNAIPALGHDWNKGRVTVQPTAWSEGEKLFTCKTCGETYAFILPKLNVNGVTADAFVEKLNGNKNNLTITVTELVGKAGSDKQTEVTYTATFSIDNNAAGTYVIGPYKVYVDTKGNNQIREIRIIE